MVVAMVEPLVLMMADESALQRAEWTAVSKVSKSAEQRVEQ